MDPVAPDLHADDRPRRWPGLLVWGIGAALMAALDGELDLANEALLLVLVSALASVWLPPVAAVGACALAVVGFNYGLVPPRGTLAVDLRQHLLLLATMLVVSGTVALLVARQRRHAAEARRQARHAGQLRALGDALRETDDAAAATARLREALAHTSLGGSVVLTLGDDGAAVLDGRTDADEAAGLRLCAGQGGAMGPGTGRHEEQPAWYLPLRARAGPQGAALLRLDAALLADLDTQAAAREHAQALCDQLGLALERSRALRQADAAREAARTQALRNTLLSAVAHDHRTPLATILGAASSLQDQGERLAPEQRRRLAATIVDESRQLARLTENTLQLARLDAPGLVLHVDWESAEELIGTTVARLRQRHPLGARLHTRVEPGLPLLRCDAVLLVQLLDNLVDNALKHGGEATPVEIVARRVGDELLLAVRDRGPGVPPAWRERIFDAFQRGDRPRVGDTVAPPARGAGVGLALCRAIARAHGGDLRLRPRAHGGSAFELWLPVPADVPAAETVA